MKAHNVYLFLSILFVMLIGVSIAHRHKHKGGDAEEGTNDNDIMEPLCANGKLVTRARREENRKSLESCSLKREDVIAVFRKGFDINNDGWFTKDECEKARGYYLKWWERPEAESCDKVFEHCDCNGDGRINEQDFEDAKDTCLRNCDTLKMIDFFIGSRMEGNAFEGVKDK